MPRNLAELDNFPEYIEVQAKRLLSRDAWEKLTLESQEVHVDVESLKNLGLWAAPHQIPFYDDITNTFEVEVYNTLERSVESTFRLWYS